MIQLRNLGEDVISFLNEMKEDIVALKEKVGMGLDRDDSDKIEIKKGRTKKVTSIILAVLMSMWSINGYAGIIDRGVEGDAEINLSKINITADPISDYSASYSNGNQYLHLPEVATASLPVGAAANEGSIVYDATTNTVKYSDGAAWATIGIAGSGTLDEGYDSGGAGAGRTITVDAGAVTLASSQAAANALAITEANAANTGNMIDITNGGLGYDIDGTASTWYVTKAGAGTFVSLTSPANTMTAATITTLNLGSVNGVASTGNSSFTTSATTGSGVLIDGSTVTTGNILRIEADAVALNGGYLINGTVDTVSKFSIGEDGKTIIAGTGAGSDALVLTAGDLTLTAGHIIQTFGNNTLTNGNLILSDGGLDVTVGAGDGDAIDIIPITTGAALDINLPGAYNLASGAIDIDGSTGSGTIIDVDFSGAYTGAVADINMTTAVGANALLLTGAGVRTVSLISITDTPSTIGTFDLNITPAGAAANANVFDIDIAGVGIANVIDLDFAADYAGDAINVNMTNSLTTQAIDITGAGARTGSLVLLTNAGANGGRCLDIASTGAHANSEALRIIESGTSTNNSIDVSYAGAYAGDALNITMTNAAAAAQALVIDGGQTAGTGAVVDISSSSAFAAGTGRLASLSTAGNFAAATSGAVLKIAEAGAAQATTYAVAIDSTSNESLIVDSGKSRFDEEVTFKASNRNTVTPNYIQAAGAANAITATLTDSDGANVVLTDGLRVTIDLNTCTLQAGANTFAINGGAALSIVSHRNVAANIAVAYLADSHVDLEYNVAGAGTWMDMSQ